MNEKEHLQISGLPERDQLSQTLVRALESPKLKDITLPELDQLMRRCMLRVGISISQIPGQAETKILYDHVLRNYGHAHTVAEIDLAFDMAIREQLDLEPSEIRCFSFSCVFFSRVIHAYRRWAGPTIQKIEASHPVLPTPKATTDWRGIIQSAYEQFHSNRRKPIHKTYPVEFHEQLVYDQFIYPFLYKELLTEARVELCNEVQKKIIVLTEPLEQAEEEREASDDLDVYNQTKPLEKQLVEYRNGSRDAEVILLAKQMCVRMLFWTALKKRMNIYVRDE